MKQSPKPARPSLPPKSRSVTMTFSGFLPRSLAVAFSLLVLFGSPAAMADEYSDVNQLLRSGKFNDALVKADQYLQTKPRDPQMRFVKGVIQSEAGKPFDAIATFTKLTEEFPELPEPYNNLAVLYAGQNQLDKARTALEMAIRTNPSYTTAHENLGDVYAKLASQAYSKALQLDANNGALQPKLALIKELFAPAVKGQKPTAGPTSTATPAAIPSASAPIAPTPSTVAPPPRPLTPPAPAQPMPTQTPVAVQKVMPVESAPVASDSASTASRDVENAVRAWANAWSKKDMGSYLGAYGREFDPPGNASRTAWEEERRQRILSKTTISVKLSDMVISVKGSNATARFRQEYIANSLTANSRKTLELAKAGDRWVIVRENASN